MNITGRKGVILLELFVWRIIVFLKYHLTVDFQRHSNTFGKHLRLRYNTALLLEKIKLNLSSAVPLSSDEKQPNKYKAILGINNHSSGRVFRNFR